MTGAAERDSTGFQLVRRFETDRETQTPHYFFCNVDLEDFLASLRGAGFDKIYCLFTSSPRWEAETGSNYAQIHFVISDGRLLPNRTEGLFRPEFEDASYIAQIRTPNPEAIPDPVCLDQRLFDAEVVVFSNHRADDMRQLARQTGLTKDMFDFYRGRRG